MDRLTKRMRNGTPYVTGTPKRKRNFAPEIVSALAQFEDEAERREHGCVYCKTGKLAVTHSIDRQAVDISHEVLYCPVCGREL